MQNLRSQILGIVRMFEPKTVRILVPRTKQPARAIKRIAKRRRCQYSNRNHSNKGATSDDYYVALEDEGNARKDRVAPFHAPHWLFGKTSKATPKELRVKRNLSREDGSTKRTAHPRVCWNAHHHGTTRQLWALEIGTSWIKLRAQVSERWRHWGVREMEPPMLFRHPRARLQSMQCTKPDYQELWWKSTTSWTPLWSQSKQRANVSWAYSYRHHSRVAARVREAMVTHHGTAVLSANPDR